MANILIVDDESYNRMLLRIRLAPRGHVVREAGNGREALDLIAANGDPDVVVLDVRMPVMDGIQFIRAYSGAAKIVVVSGCEDDVDMDAAAWVSDWLVKPYTTEDLLDTIEEALK